MNPEVWIEIFKSTVRFISGAAGILILLVIYIWIWRSLIKDFKWYISTGYGYPCFEKFLQGFYTFWIFLHFGLIIFLIVWAWS